MDANNKDENLLHIEQVQNDIAQEIAQVKLQIEQDKQNRKHKISASMIIERCIAKDVLQSLSSEDEIAEEVLRVNKLFLDRLGIESMDNMECYTNVTHVYLQYNKISAMSDALEFLPQLSFLALFNNSIAQVEHVQNLSQLEYLDVANNKIETLQVEQLPTSLRFFTISGNPCVDTEEKDSQVRKLCILHLPNLIVMNDKPVLREEREAIGAEVNALLYDSNKSLPINVSNDDTQLLEEVVEPPAMFTRNYEELDVQANNEYDMLVQSMQKMHEHRVTQMNQEFDKIHQIISDKKNQVLENSRQRRRQLLEEYAQQRAELMQELENK